MSRQITICDHSEFYRVMQDPDNIRPLLEALIDKAIDRIIPARRHELLGVHVNAFTHDGFTYDISLQLVENDDLGKRLRASQAIMDADFLSPDNFGDETLRSCVIFVCKNAPNSHGKAVRRIQKVIHTLDNIPFNDGTSALILNMSYTERNAADLVCEFLNWMDACRKGETYDISGSEYLTNLVNGIPYEMTLPENHDSSELMRALRECGEAAKRNGTAHMTLEEINEEIAAARRERDSRRAE